MNEIRVEATRDVFYGEVGRWVDRNAKQTEQRGKEGDAVAVERGRGEKDVLMVRGSRMRKQEWMMVMMVVMMMRWSEA